MRKLFTLLMLLSLNNAQAYKSVSGHEAFTNEIKEYIDTHQIKPRDVLVVYDIDNTLLRFKTNLASDQWYQWQKKEIQQGCPTHCIATTHSEMLKVSHQVTYLSKMLLVDEDIPRSIYELQRDRFSVVALTSRGPINRVATQRELKANSINITKGLTLNNDFSGKYSGRDIEFANGVFMTSGLNKGEMLKKLLSMNKQKKFKAIFFLDDRLKHVKAMDSHFESQEVHSYRLTTMDKMVEKFNESDKKIEIMLGNKLLKVLGSMNL